MRSLVVLLFVAGVVQADEPKFTVENRTTPKFTVENRSGYAAYNASIKRMKDALDRMEGPLKRLEKAAPYIPPPCAACNRGDVQCACPQWYGVCSCSTATITAPAVPSARPFPAGNTIPVGRTDAGTVAAPSRSLPALVRFQGRTGTTVRAGTGFGTSGCLTG